MSVLVLGAGGLIGSALVRAGGVGLDRRALDITDLLAFGNALAHHKPDAVINAAAMARVDEADRDAELTHVVNGVAVAFMAEICAFHKIRFVHISSDYVLDSDAPGRLTEAEPPRPRSTYAESKARGERLCLPHNAVVVRVQWVYDPRRPGFYSRTLDALARGERPRLVTDQVGCPTPAALVATALLRAAAGGPTGLFHLACDGEATPWDWVEAGASARGLNFQAEPITRVALGGAHRPARSCLDSRRFAAAFGVRLPDWRQALCDAEAALRPSAQAR